MVLPTFAETKVGRTEGYSIKLILMARRRRAVQWHLNNKKQKIMMYQFRINS
jgi:hypothetical protein